MLRTLLASPWLPLLYWTAVVVSLLFGVRQVPFKSGPGRDRLPKVVGVSAPASARQDRLPRPETYASKRAIANIGKPAPLWSPLISVLQITDPLLPESESGLEVANNKTSDFQKRDPSIEVPATTLSIRADRSGQELSEALAIRCRTDIAIRHGHRDTVPIRGVVTQEVVSSTGKILIMAGSRVVGSGRVDPENGRIKSDGLWSIFFDDSELQVRAQLLDRPGGLPGLLGTPMPFENAALQKETVMPGTGFISVARNAPFILELHGEMLLRDTKSIEATN